MRIISQDGNFSVDFDSAVIFCTDESICCQNNFSKWCLGKYDSADDASIVFLDIHNEWENDCMTVYQMPAKDNAAYFAER